MAAFYRGHSAESLDQRTYIQMVRAVSDRGLPYWDNGPLDRFGQLVTYWGVAARGHVWGIYGIVYPYVVAPAFRLGGLKAVSVVTLGMLAPLAYVTFLIARRLVQNAWYAVLAGVLSVISLPILAKSLETTAYPLFTLLATLAIYLTMRAVEAEERAVRFGAAAGMAWGAATATHVMCLPMGLGALVVLALAPPSAGKSRVHAFSARVVPTTVSFVGALLPSALVNHVRFGTYNPISYGGSGGGMTMAAQSQYALPVAAWLGATGIAVFALRKKRLAWVGAIVVAVAVALLIAPLRERVLRYALVACGYVATVSVIDLAPFFQRAKDGLGWLNGGWAVKGVLQGTPLLVLAPFALARAGARRWALLAVLVPCLCMIGSLAARANLENIEAVGWPWVYPRYTSAALPGLLALSIVAVERIRASRWHFVGAASTGIAMTIGLMFFTEDDSSWAKRFLLLVVPLVLALAAVVVMMRASTSRAAAVLLVPIVGVGIGSALGHDLRANADAKKACDNTINDLDSVMPERFALLGPIGPIDVLLTSTATHDVRYADVDRLGSLKANRPLVDYWRSEGRPPYLVSVERPTSPWPDVSFVRVEPMSYVYRFDFHPPTDR